MQPRLALYIGGMDARGHNVHFNVFARMGFEEVALRGAAAACGGVALAPYSVVTTV